jgi:hypothetical protein
LTPSFSPVTIRQNKLSPSQSATYPLFSIRPERPYPNIKSEIMFLDTEIYNPGAAVQPAPSLPSGETAAPEKRNSGRTGPTSPEGRAISSQNSFKHGGCSQTLILPGEDIEAWQLLLNRFCQTYRPAADTLEYDFVHKTAQAEWYRIRAQRNYDFYLAQRQGLSPFNWAPHEIKMHDLLLRYKTGAERGFQREYRLLEQHYKIHRPVPAAKEPSPEPAAPIAPYIQKETACPIAAPAVSGQSAFFNESASSPDLPIGDIITQTDA